MTTITLSNDCHFKEKFYYSFFQFEGCVIYHCHFYVKYSVLLDILKFDQNIIYYTLHKEYYTQRSILCNRGVLSYRFLNKKPIGCVHLQFWIQQCLNISASLRLVPFKKGIDTKWLLDVSVWISRHSYRDWYGD